MQQNKVEGQTSIDEIIRRNREQLKTIRWLKQQPEEAEDGVVTEIKEIPASSGKYATLLAQSTSTFGNLNGISISQQQRNSNPQTQTVTQMQQTGTPVTARQTGMIQNEAVRTVDKHTADTIDRIAKRTGFSVEFVQGVQEAGSYQDGKIRINTESGDPVRQIFVHELTHHLEQSGEYGALSQAILTEIDEAGALSEVQEYVRERYAENGHALDNTGLDREVVAWFAEENLFTDERAISNLAHKNRSLFQKIRNWLHDLRVKLRGTAEEKFVLRTEKLYQKALNSVNGQKNNASGETQYSLKRTPNGETYWEIDAEADIFRDIKGYKELKTKAYEYLLNGDKGRRIETLIDGEPLEFRRISANEYIYGRQSKTLGKKEFNQKMRMAPSIPDLIENAAVTWDAPDMKNHKLFPNGFKNYRGKVGIDETIFNYIVRVGKAVNGQVFYDINLEADNSVPSARKHVSDASVPSASERVSDVKVSASDSSIVQNQSTGNPQTQTVTQMQQTPARQTGVIQNEAVHTVDKHTADTIDRIAKRTGFSVEFVQGVQEAGSYQDGKIRINTESGDPVRQIFVHELTHYLEQSGEYHTLADAIANNLKHSQIDTSVLKRQIINEYAKNGVVLSEDGANREMIAKYAESYLFADASSIQRLAQENRSLVQKIRDWLHDLRVKLRGTAEEKFILRTEKLYQKALNSVNGQKNNASGETQYMPTRINSTNSVGGFIPDKYFQKQVSRWQELEPSSRIHIGKLSQESPLVQAGLRNADIYMNNSKLILELTQHGDHLTPELVSRIPDLISDPIMLNDPSIGRPKLRGAIDVYGDLSLEDNTPVLVGITIAKDASGTYTINKINTIHARRNWADNISDESVLYLNPDKKRTKAWFHSRGTDVPLDGIKFGSIRSIADIFPDDNAFTKESVNGTSAGQKNNASGETQYSFSEQKIPSYEELIAKPDIPIVDIRGRGEGRIAEQRKQFLNSPEANKLYEAPVINRDTGEPVFITPHTLQHTFSNIGFAQINAGKNLAKIIENAVLTHTEAITHKNQNALAIFTLFGAVRTEQGIQPIKLKVKEYRIGKQRLPAMIQSYFDKNGVFEPYASAYDGRVLELESIEKEEVSSSALPTLVAEATQGEHPSTSSYIRVADLYDLVNSEYQKYLPQKEQGNPAYAQGSSFDKLLRDAGYKKQADALKKAVKQYGTYERGEYAARDVQIPKQMNDETRVSRFSRTAAEASVLTDEQAGEIGKAVAEGRFDYEPIPDEAARAHAEAIMERGENAAQNVWDRVVNGTRPASKNDIAVGEYLLKQAAEAGDTQRVVELTAQIAAEGTRAGQIVQAMRMLKKLDGAGQAIALDTTLKKLQAELDSNKKNKTFLEVPLELRERLVAAKGEQQVGEVMDEIYQNIADQLPVRWSDKWNAWRYLSMLGNLRTHIRNVLGNAAFAPVVGVKNSECTFMRILM